MADCEDYDVVVPHKKKLHLKWCLLDDEVKDFTKEVTETEGGGPPEDTIVDSNASNNSIDGRDVENEVRGKAESDLLEKFPVQIDLRNAPEE